MAMFQLRAALFSLIIALGSAHAQASLVSVWGFEESSGSTVIDSAGSNDGVLSAGASRAATGLNTGPFGQALSVDGDDLVTVSDDNSLDFSGSFSVQAWINPGAVGGVVAAKHDASDRGWSLDYANISGNRVRFTVYSGSSFSDRIEATSFLVNTGVWTHIAAVYDQVNDTIRIYRNGSLATNTPFEDTGWSGTPRTNAQSLRIGDGFNGLLDEVAVFNDIVASGATYSGYDQSLVTTIPEPGAISMIGIGIVLMLRRAH
jgi:hypothetical protein